MSGVSGQVTTKDVDPSIQLHDMRALEKYGDRVSTELAVVLFSESEGLSFQLTL